MSHVVTAMTVINEFLLGNKFSKIMEDVVWGTCLTTNFDSGTVAHSVLDTGLMTDHKDSFVFTYRHVAFTVLLESGTLKHH